MKKRLFVIFALLLLIPTLIICTFTACSGDGDKEGEETTTGVTEPRGEAIGSELVRNKQLGFFAYGEVVSDNDYVADATVRPQNDGVSVKFYSDGTANLTVKDYWGNVATVAVTVENSEISNIDVTPFSDSKSVNVRFVGAFGTGNVDDTKSIQEAIDSLPNGGTVYFPAGTYNIDKIVLREGITLMLQGKVDNVSSGYTKALAERVANREFAILKDGSFVNHEPNGPGNLGASNIAIIGGMIDFNGAAATKTQIDVNQEGPEAHPGWESTGCIAISGGSNYRFENIIIKDIYNAHAFQICGVSDVVIKDCMFAGYMGRAEEKGSSAIVTNRETIQIEYAHSGAIPPATFEEGEFYYCKNVAIEGCYFGDSDKSGYHVTAIGQHGQNGTANVDGLTVTKCVFDNPYYTAMRFPNYTNVEISNNSFISDEKGYVGGGYFLWFYTENANKSYAGKTQSGSSATVVSAHAYEHDGLHHFDITNNVFLIKGDSNIRVINASSTTGLTPGARTITGVMRQVEGQLYGANYSGFIKCTNLISDINFSDNTISVEADGYTYKSVAVFTSVYNLVAENNQISTANGVNLTANYNGQVGINVVNPVNETSSNQYSFITSLPSASIMVSNGKGGYIVFKADSTTARTLKLQQTEHCKIEYKIENGNVRVNVVCDEGYTFSGWKNGSANYNPSSTVTMSGNITLVAVCTQA